MSKKGEIFSAIGQTFSSAQAVAWGNCKITEVWKLRFPMERKTSGEFRWNYRLCVCSSATGVGSAEVVRLTTNVNGVP